MHKLKQSDFPRALRQDVVKYSVIPIEIFVSEMFRPCYEFSNS